MLTDCGYFNINIDTTKVPDCNNVLIEISHSNQNSYSINIDKLVNIAVEKIELEKLIDIYNNFEHPAHIRLIKEDEIIIFQQGLKCYIQSMLNGLLIAFNDNIIEGFSIFYPFVRVSLEDNIIIKTYFSSIKYIDSKKELWITEAIPDEEYIMNSGITSLDDLINAALFSVRSSAYFENIYSYPVEVKSDIIINYKLDIIVKSNFNVDIIKNFVRVSFASKGIWSYSINSKNSSKKSVFFDPSKPIIAIGINNPKLEYLDYMSTALSHIFFYESLCTIFKRFMKLIKSTKTNTLMTVHQQQFGVFLNKALKKDNIYIQQDVKLIINRESKYVRENFILNIVKVAGAFLSGYNN